MASRIRALLVTGMAGAVGLGIMGVALGRGGHVEVTDDAYLRADIVAISSRIGGAVKAVLVQANQPVSAGQLLLELDSQDYQLKLDAAQANVAQTDAALDANAHARKLAHADAALLDTERAGLLAKRDAARALAALAKMDLDATRVIAPRDGVVGNLVAEAGARVAPGQRLLSLVAQDRFWIDANLKETQLRDLAIGQIATVELDAWPDHHYLGRVESFSPAAGSEFALLPAENASGNFTRVVQRVAVRIALSDADTTMPGLRPGLSAHVRIDTAAVTP